MWIMWIKRWEYVFVSEKGVKIRIISTLSVDNSVYMCITLWEIVWKQKSIHDKIVYN